jgi:hypothetical protein
VFTFTREPLSFDFQARGPGLYFLVESNNNDNINKDEQCECCIDATNSFFDLILNLLKYVLTASERYDMDPRATSEVIQGSCRYVNLRTAPGVG